MAICYGFFLCRMSVIDRDANQITAIGLTEALAVDTLDPPAGATVATLPLEAHVHVERSNRDVPEVVTIRLLWFDGDEEIGIAFQGMTAPLEKPRLRARILNPFAPRQFGRLHLVAEIAPAGTTDWNRVPLRWPVEIEQHRPSIPAAAQE